MQSGGVGEGWLTLFEFSKGGVEAGYFSSICICNPKNTFNPALLKDQGILDAQ
jgi:hypothetical protein